MHKEHPEFTKPGGNPKLWRFMNFTKFVNMLHSNALYFCRVDLLGDPFEGMYTEVTIKNREKILDILLPPSSPGIIQLREETKKNNALLDQLFSRSNFASCWHMNEYEPYSMWKSYTTTNEAVSIQTSLNKFINSFSEASDDVLIGEMNYLDYKKDDNKGSTSFKRLLTKRKNFEHESELRAIVCRPPLNDTIPDPNNAQRTIVNWNAFPSGLDIKSELNVLIERIIIAPNATQWFKSTVESVCEKYGIRKPIEDSELDQVPPSY